MAEKRLFLAVSLLARSSTPLLALIVAEEEYRAAAEEEEEEEAYGEGASLSTAREMATVEG